MCFIVQGKPILIPYRREILFGLPDEEAVVNRLLRNAKDFATLFRQYYGQDVGAEFEELLTAHFTIAAELVKAVKAGETATATNADKRWYENANQIADFLSGINPYWSAQEWKNMLYDHLALTKKETESILKGNYEESINVFDEIERQALMMADTMMQGMRKQFSQYL